MVNNIYQLISATILNNEIRTFGCTGSYARIITWNSTTALRISFDGSSFQDIKAGMFIKLMPSADPFTIIYVQNLTGGDLLLEMGVSSGEIGDDRLATVGTITAIVPGKATSIGYGLVPLSNVAPGTVIVAANTARRSVIITNLAGNTGSVYIGFSNLLTTLKYVVMLAPGENYAIDDYTGEIYGLQTVNLENVSYGEI